MCRISCANPPMTLMTMTSSATPSATPSVEIRVKKGNRRPVGNSCRRARWRYQGTGSGAACRLRLRGAKLREEDDVADALRARQEHAEPVDAHAHAACGRHAVLEGEEEVVVDALRLAPGLPLEHLALDVGIVLLRVRRGDLHAADAQLEHVEGRRILAAYLRERIELPRQVEEEPRSVPMTSRHTSRSISRTRAIMPRWLLYAW